MIVADASALLEYLLGTDAAPFIAGSVRAPDADLHVPALCDIEVGSGLRRAMLGKELSESRAIEALDDYLDLPLSRHGHRSLLGRVLELRANFSAYDATYVALAEQLGADLLTADSRLIRSVRTHTLVAVRS
ncbi:MAG: type II toxin-antitoxin system VapC family toxin [Actinomycetota bacterium]